MDQILRAASTQTLEELVEALLIAANDCSRWEDGPAAKARDLMNHLGLSWQYGDWQQAYETVGLRALKVLRLRYAHRVDLYVC